MIYFPPLLPDELLYSVLARYHVWSGIENYRKTMRDLFGAMNVCAVTDLPCHLQHLCDRIPGKAVSVDDLLWKHTLLAYYAPFMEQGQLQLVIDEMLYDNGNSLYMKLGLVASGVKNNKMLQYCLECAGSDRKNYGVAYFHRSHQLPGVRVCYKHHVYLKESEIYYSQPRHKHQYISLDTIIDASSISHNTERCNDPKEIEYSSLSHQLLELSSVIRRSALHREKLYDIALYNMRFLHARGGKAFSRIIPAMSNYWGEEFLLRLGSSLNTSNETWVHRILRKQRHGFHPVRHLLLHGFLCMDIRESMLGDIGDVQSMYFGSAPWSCLNKAADHFMDSVVKECLISRCSKTGNPVGTFICDCGFIYSRTGPDRSKDDRYRIGRIKQFGSVWIKRLEDISKDKSLSLRERARQLGVDPNTIKGQLKKIEVGQVDTEVVARASNRTTRGIVTISSVGKKHTVRIDWSIRDKEISEKVKHCVDKMKHNPNVRITNTEIGRRIGVITLLQTKLSKMPVTEELLKAHVESTEQFQRRRIVIRTTELKQSRTKLKEWRVAKAAGLSSKVFYRLKLMISATIEQLERSDDFS